MRDADEFAAAHVDRAINVPLSGSSFATKSGFVLGDAPVVIQASSTEQAERRRKGSERSDDSSSRAT